MSSQSRVGESMDESLASNDSKSPNKMELDKMEETMNDTSQQNEEFEDEEYGSPRNKSSKISDMGSQQNHEEYDHDEEYGSPPNKSSKLSDLDTPRKKGSLILRSLLPTPTNHTSRRKKAEARLRKMMAKNENETISDEERSYAKSVRDRAYLAEYERRESVRERELWEQRRINRLFFSQVRKSPEQLQEYQKYQQLILSDLWSPSPEFRKPNGVTIEQITEESMNQPQILEYPSYKAPTRTSHDLKKLGLPPKSVEETLFIPDIRIVDDYDIGWDTKITAQFEQSYNQGYIRTVPEPPSTPFTSPKKPLTKIKNNTSSTPKSYYMGRTPPSGSLMKERVNISGRASLQRNRHKEKAAARGHSSSLSHSSSDSFGPNCMIPKFSKHIKGLDFFHPIRWTSAEISFVTTLYKIYGTDWNIISSFLGRVKSPSVLNRTWTRNEGEFSKVVPISSFESIQCQVCKGPAKSPSKIVFCECCDRAYHLRCTDPALTQIPETEWFCSDVCSQVGQLNCYTCGKATDEDHILLCDKCDHGYHMYCLSEPLTEVPEGDWFCDSCSNNSPSKSRLDNSSQINRDMDFKESEMKRIESNAQKLFLLSQECEHSNSKFREKKTKKKRKTLLELPLVYTPSEVPQVNTMVSNSIKIPWKDFVYLSQLCVDCLIDFEEGVVPSQWSDFVPGHVLLPPRLAQSIFSCQIDDLNHHAMSNPAETSQLEKHFANLLAAVDNFVDQSFCYPLLSQTIQNNANQENDKNNMVVDQSSQFGQQQETRLSKSSFIPSNPNTRLEFASPLSKSANVINSTTITGPHTQGAQSTFFENKLTITTSSSMSSSSITSSSMSSSSMISPSSITSNESSGEAQFSNSPSLVRFLPGSPQFKPRFVKHAASNTTSLVEDGEDGYSLKDHRFWIFQANPKLYDIASSLKYLKTMTWVTRQNQTRIRAGDKVFVWESGKDAGIVALAVVLTNPDAIPEHPDMRAFTCDLSKFNRNELRCTLSIERVLPRKLTKTEILTNPKLNHLTILRAPIGTNFRVTKAESEMILDKLMALDPLNKFDEIKIQEEQEMINNQENQKKDQEMIDNQNSGNNNDKMQIDSEQMIGQKTLENEKSKEQIQIEQKIESEKNESSSNEQSTNNVQSHRDDQLESKESGLESPSNVGNAPMNENSIVESVASGAVTPLDDDEYDDINIETTAQVSSESSSISDPTITTSITSTTTSITTTTNVLDSNSTSTQITSINDTKPSNTETISNNIKTEDVQEHVKSSKMEIVEESKEKTLNLSESKPSTTDQLIGSNIASADNNGSNIASSDNNGSNTSSSDNSTSNASSSVNTTSNTSSSDNATSNTSSSDTSSSDVLVRGPRDLILCLPRVLIVAYQEKLAARRKRPGWGSLPPATDLSPEYKLRSTSKTISFAQYATRPPHSNSHGKMTISSSKDSSIRVVRIPHVTPIEPTLLHSRTSRLEQSSRPFNSKLARCPRCSLAFGKKPLVSCKQCTTTFHMNCVLPHKKPSASALSDWRCSTCQKVETLICKVCGNGDDEEHTVLCDGCDDAYHLRCLKPPLTDVPGGTWMCKRCDLTQPSLVRVKLVLALRELRLEAKRLIHQRAELAANQHKRFIDSHEKKYHNAEIQQQILIAQHQIQQSYQNVQTKSQEAQQEAQQDKSNSQQNQTTKSTTMQATASSASIPISQGMISEPIKNLMSIHDHLVASIQAITLAANRKWLEWRNQVSLNLKTEPKANKTDESTSSSISSSSSEIHDVISNDVQMTGLQEASNEPQKQEASMSAVTPTSDTAA